MMLHKSLQSFDKLTAPGGPAWMRTLGFLLLLIWAAALANRGQIMVESDPAYRGMALLLDDNGWLVIVLGLLIFTLLAIFRDGTTWLAAVSLSLLASFEIVIWFLITVQSPGRVLGWMHLAAGAMTAAAFIRQIMVNVSHKQLADLQAEYETTRKNEE
jgi:hypothetical protein